MRVAVIGDVAGHCHELRNELARLGAGPDGRLPDDLRVVQVGDLVHRGPDSESVVDLVDWYLAEQPEQWTQLVGNHEACYLRPPQFDWRDRVPRRSARKIRRWWRSGAVAVAAAVHTDDESFLVTHAGVTETFWRETLDEPETAEQAAKLINELAREGARTVFRGGQILHGCGPQPETGPLWTDCASELLPGWSTQTLPFSQVYGHSSITDWRCGGERPTVPVRIDPDAKHEQIVLAGGRLVGIDPGHGAEPTRPWRAFEIVGADYVR